MRFEYAEYTACDIHKFTFVVAGKLVFIFLNKERKCLYIKLMEYA